MIDADQNTVAFLFIALALVAHIASRRFTPFKQIVRITGEPSYFVIHPEDTEVTGVIKFLIFQALKWVGLGMAVAIWVF